MQVTQKWKALLVTVLGGYVVGAPHKLMLPYLPLQICGDSQEQFTEHHHFTFQFKVSFSN